MTESRNLKIPLVYWSRYLRIVLKYCTLTKFINLFQAYLYYLQNAPRIPTLPAFLKIEVSRLCHVKCKYCSEKKAKLFYPFSLYQELINKYKDYIFVASLYEIGEPLLHEDIVKIINYAHLNNIGTIISTSLSVDRPDSFWRDLVLSGLDYLIIAIDGITAEVYNQYRTHGDLKLVLANLKKIQLNKDRFKINMFIEWQMIDLPWNKHEQKAAKNFARELGCDNFRLITDATIPRANYSKEISSRQRNCLLPFITLIINAFNEVRPCYKMYGLNTPIGDLFQNTFEEIWNGAEIGKIRDKAAISGRIPCCYCKE